MTTPADHRPPITDDRLTLADLTRALPDLSRSLLQRYDANPELRRLLEKDEATRTYPAWTLAYWQRIAEARAQTPPLVRPETAGVFLRGLLDPRSAVIDDRLPVIATPAETLPVQMGESALALLTRLVEIEETLLLRLPAGRIVIDPADLVPPPDDCLLTVTDVTALLRCSPSAARRRVKPVLRGRWRRSDVLRYIAGLGA